MNRFGRYIQCTIQIYKIPRKNPASAYSVRIPAIPDTQSSFNRTPVCRQPKVDQMPDYQ